MAQKVGYLEDFDDITEEGRARHVQVFSEGPFVMVAANGWRIEAEFKGHKCPVLPDASIYDLLKLNKKEWAKTCDEEPIRKSVDWLNERVRTGEVVLEPRGFWYCPEPYGPRCSL